MNSAGIVTLQPRGLIRLDAVGRAVRFAEGVAVEAGDQFPHFANLLRRVAARSRAMRRTPPRISSMTAQLLFVQRAAQARPRDRESVRRRLRRFAECVPRKRRARRCCANTVPSDGCG